MSLQPLDKALRSQLEKAIKQAREVAEKAALAAVEQLGVGEAKVFSHLDKDERKLRVRLRAHGRQLGDPLDPNKETQEIDRLVEEVAYEHWHRMLFARFLAENNLLMYPDPDEPVAVSLEECDDLATDEGASNGWELAARYAGQMLPQIFQTDSPVFQLTLPPEHQQRLERLLSDLPADIFHASDSLGWVYQYWQAKKKKEINDAEVKIGARELPAVTQLFTEPYMVAFLLDNSLGAWWAAQVLTEDDLTEAKDEEELRRKASLQGVSLGYLRFVRDENGNWSPAAGTFDGWPTNLAELKTLDPCCGSGHFLVAAFLMLVPIRMKRENLTADEAIERVLTENIHGLEIDQRCVELAAFALALTAWKYPGSGGYRPLPRLSVACSGLSVSVAKEKWTQLKLGSQNLRIAMGLMHDTFADAPVLGSLINPTRTDAAKIVEWGELSTALEEALSHERPEAQQEVAVVAHGLAEAATLLAGQYHWVITNVPYLSRGKQNEVLRDHCARYYPSAKRDLATVFLQRCLDWCVEGGTTSVVLPQNWLFLTSYRQFREKLLKTETWNLVARLGEGGFDSPAAAGAFVAMLTMSRGNASGYSGGLFGDTGPAGVMRGLDVSESRSASEKATDLLTAEVKSVAQAKQLENPDARVVLDSTDGMELLVKHADSYQGVSPADLPRFGRSFWESHSAGLWTDWQSTVSAKSHFGGRERILWMDEVRKKADLEGTAYIRGTESWCKDGVVISAMRDLHASISKGAPSDTNVAVIIPKDPDHLPAIWCFCSSPEYNEAVRRIDQKINVTNATLVKVPFNLDRWTKAAKQKYPNGLPKPYSDDPTQWIFHGHPCGSVMWDEGKKRTAHSLIRNDSTVLQTAVARLLGYRWPAELDPDMELSDEQREWVGRCEVLLPFAAKTGIVCIPPVRGEKSAADRLLDLLAAAYGDEWSNELCAELLKQADHADKTLESWLRDKFFAQHCRLFHQRPFIWHIWDGLPDGFAALVNYHKLDRKTLEMLIHTYLGDWIRRQKDEIGKVDGAQERLNAAENLKKQLELIQEGAKPYDIFVRWKPLASQAIGWDPDLNDGVRLNIRPFVSVGDVTQKDAGVLRIKPGIHWNKDRGKDVATAPWFALFGRDRINNHHLTLEDKRAAGEQKEGMVT